jgi:hypothetical protein
VVASLLFAVAVGKEHSCTATVVVVVAGTAGAGITSDCPNTAVEGDIADLRVGCTPYGTLEEHQ